MVENTNEKFMLLIQCLFLFCLTECTESVGVNEANVQIVKWQGMIDPYRADSIRVRLVDRFGWGARPAAGTVPPLARPYPAVLFYYDSGTDPCHSHEECVRTVQQLQQQHMDMGLPDIAYNFLIGGDGTVYEGRGWGAQPSTLKQEYAHLEGRSFAVTYIGRFTRDRPAYHDMANAATSVLNLAVLNEHMDGTFEFHEDVIESTEYKYRSFDIDAINTTD